MIWAILAGSAANSVIVEIGHLRRDFDQFSVNSAQRLRPTSLGPTQVLIPQEFESAASRGVKMQILLRWNPPTRLRRQIFGRLQTSPRRRTQQFLGHRIVAPGSFARPRR